MTTKGLNMKKLIPIVIGENRWIQISQLSSDQASSLKSWLPKECIKNLMLNGIPLNECVDFRNYDYWFKNHQLSKEIGFAHQF